MARDKASQRASQRPKTKDASLMEKKKGAPFPAELKRASKLVSFVKALKAGAASVAKKAAGRKPQAKNPAPVAAKKAAPVLMAAAKKPVAKTSVVKKPARKPTLKAAPAVAARASKKAAASAAPVPLVSVVKKPSRGPSKRLAAKRIVERRRTPRPAPSPVVAAPDENFPIRPFEVKVSEKPQGQQRPNAWLTDLSAQEPAFSIPTGYGDNHIVLMVKDPWWLFAYWEIQPQVERAARAQLLPHEVAGLQTVLRVCDVTGRRYPEEAAYRTFDISLSGMASNWYIKTDAPNRSFIVEIGLLASSGRFLLLARSNAVTPPRYGPSDVIDEEWVTTDEDYWKLFGATTGIGTGSSQPGISGISSLSGIGANLSSAYFSGSWSSTNLYGLNKASPVKGFWCRVDTDLVIHGTAEPRSRVAIQGQPVAIRKDGTFSLRLALPEGTQTIAIEVISPDGKKSQTLTPIVSIGWKGTLGAEGASRPSQPSGRSENS